MTTHNFTLHGAATAPAGSVDILTNVEKNWGFVPNLHRVLAESPVALEAYAALWNLAEKTRFTAVERNVAYLAIIFKNECHYCMAGHTNLSKMAHVEAQHIAAIREGKPISDPKLEALRRFATAVIRNRGVVSDVEVAAFKAAGYDNGAMLDVLVLAATKLISNYANHFADTPLDEFMKGAEWTPPARKSVAA